MTCQKNRKVDSPNGLLMLWSKEYLLTETKEFLLPTNKVYGKVMFFTPGCQSVYRGVSVPACITCHMTGRVSVQGVSIQGVSVMGVSLQGCLSGRPSYSYGRAVCILLECILVSNSAALSGLKSLKNNSNDTKNKNISVAKVVTCCIFVLFWNELVCELIAA